MSKPTNKSNGRSVRTQRAAADSGHSAPDDFVSDRASGPLDGHLASGPGSRSTPSEATPESATKGSVGAPGAHRELENAIAAHFADLATLLAQPRSYGQIYGLLFASTRPLSFTDIVERLALSKGAVSIGLNALRGIGAIHPAAGPDWRREHFVAETELRALIGGFLKESLQPQLKDGQNRIETLRTRFKPALRNRNADGKLLLERLDKLYAWHKRGSTILPFVTKFLG